MDSNNFCRVPLGIIMQYGEEIPFDLYLKLSDQKWVKIGHQQEDIKDIFAKYQAKGVEDVFAHRESYMTFLGKLKDQLSYKLFDPDTTEQESVDLLAGSYQVVRESFVKLGVSEIALEVAQEVAKSSQQLIKNHPNLFEFFKKYRESCGDAYMRSILVGFITSCMLDFFEWKSVAIKEKLTLAALLRDLLLTAEEFKRLEESEEVGEFADLSETIINHPLDMTKMLQNSRGDSWVAQEVIAIIEQHHERPDGTGFPRKISHLRINQLASIHVVADHFIRSMIAAEFNMGARDDILQRLKIIFKQGSFKKSVEALCLALGIKGKA